MDRFDGKTLFEVPAGMLPDLDAAPDVYDTIGAVELADLMMVSLLRGHSEQVVLQPEGDASRLLITRNDADRVTTIVPAEVGSAAAARLARMAGLDPLVASSTMEGRANVARVRVRAGDDVGEVLVAISATPHGLEVELRPVSRNGRAPTARHRGHLKRCTRCNAYQAPQLQKCTVDGAPLVEVADDPSPGGTVGAYRVLGVLGEGGMGTVFAGEHALIGRVVAIKVLHRSLANNPAVARRFLTEARAASRLRHPNVVGVTDFGLLADGHPFMVMEQVVGTALDARLELEGALPALTALLVAREVTLALEAAHDAGVLHNDLKPSNVMMLDGSEDESPSLKLLDFGAASLVGDAGDAEDIVVGTPRYMSPERARGEPIDARADIYALGIMLFEMLSGAVPLTGSTPQNILMAQMMTPPPPLTSPYGALPPSVIRLVARALAKSSAERQQSAREVIGDLDIAIEALRRPAWRRWLP